MQRGAASAAAADWPSAGPAGSRRPARSFRTDEGRAEPATDRAASYRCLAASGLTPLLDRLQHADDAIVTETLQVLDGPAAGLRGGAFHHALDQLLRQLRGLVVGPGQVERGAELLEHVAHAALAAGQMIDQVRAHEGPADARAVP